MQYKVTIFDTITFFFLGVNVVDNHYPLPFTEEVQKAPVLL